MRKSNIKSFKTNPAATKFEAKYTLKGCNEMKRICQKYVLLSEPKRISEISKLEVRPRTIQLKLVKTKLFSKRPATNT